MNHSLMMSRAPLERGRDPAPGLYAEKVSGGG